MITCNRSYCYHPGGATQPEANFMDRNGKRLRACQDCRRVASAKQRDYRRRQSNKPPLPPADSSVADIDPVYAERLRAWVVGLVIRRDGHPLTRDIGQAGGGKSDGSKKCVIKGCTNVHRTKYKLCPACREVNRLRLRERRAAAKQRARGNEQSTSVI